MIAGVLLHDEKLLQPRDRASAEIDRRGEGHSAARPHEPREFRTAPLWGLGQRVFFLHDGRTKDLIQAIRAHSSDGSEANEVVRRFEFLRDSTKQDLLNFLRSL